MKGIMNNVAETDIFILRSMVSLGCTPYFVIWLLYNDEHIEQFSSEY